MADFHDPVIETPKSEPSSRRISAVWLIPLIALAISLAVAWRSYNDRGPTIEIVLDSAAGVTAGATTLRYRDVQFGVVEKLGFTPDLRQVVLTARIDKDMARYLDDSAQFWVVRPSVTAQGVTGIETVLSGVYIEAQWSGEAGARVERFTALPRAPLTPAGTAGRRVTLRAPDGGSLAVGAPVLFKKIAVGRVESVELQPTGEIQVALFVNAPYDAFLTQGVRFWNASGFSIQLGAGGASLNVESLISLLQGGVSFAQVDADATPAPDGRVFDLFASESAARQNAVETLPGARVSLDIFLHGSVAGLQPGAPVIFRGVTVGDVAALEPIVEGEGDQRRLSMRATLSIAQQRLGLPAEASADQALALLNDLVDQGLRARLASAGLLSQTLQVELSEMPDAPPARMNLEALPHPILPSAPADSSGLSASAEGLMNRLSSLPIEELMTTVTTLVGNVNALVTSPEVRSAPENVGALIADIREVVETSGIKDTPAQIAATLASIQSVVSDLETRKVMASLADTLETTRVTIQKFGVVADGVPRLVDETATLADRVNALPLDAFIASATRTVDGIDALVRSDGAAALPGSVDATLAEARGLIADLRQGGAVENASATLASLKELTDQLKAADLGAQIAKVTAAAERATANVDAATKGLPELMENLRALSARVNDLPLDQLVTSADTVLRSADALLGAEGMDKVPTELAASLAEVRAMVAELREGGAVTNLNSALASADEAAAAITAASANLPQLIASINAATARADLALSTFEPGSQINRETQNLLRDLRTAAQSVNALVTALERKPNSVLFGR